MRILFLGGTRFIGLAIARALAAGGHELAVFHRGKTAANLPLGTTEFLGDKHELDASISELREWNPDAVVDMLCFTEADAHRTLEAFSGHAARLAMISSCDVYRAFGILLGQDDGEPQSVPLREDSELRRKLYPYRGEEPRAAGDPRRFMDDYDKILCERIVLGQDALPATVLRLPMVYGPGDPQHRLAPYLRRIVDARPALLLSAHDAERRLCRGYIDNVGAACALAISSEAASGRVFNVADEPTLVEQHWAQLVADAAGYQGRIAVLPDEQLQEALRGMPTPQELLVDTTAIRSLGFSEPVALEDAIARTIAWELANLPSAEDLQLDYAAEDAATPAGG